ncbi:MAG: hypothetical protein GY800_14460 [Planctomycetes bacterium]|nr:hypothetical protein [Planctomycetota bacterium]
MWFAAVLGLLGSLFTFFVGFFPPEQLPSENIIYYELFLCIGVLVAVAIPMVIYQFRKPGWAVKPEFKAKQR